MRKNDRKAIEKILELGKRELNSSKGKTLIIPCQDSQGDFWTVSISKTGKLARKLLPKKTPKSKTPYNPSDRDSKLVI